MLFYVTSYSDDERGGVYLYNLTSDGRPDHEGFVPLRHAGYLAFSTDRKTLYCTCIVDETTDGVAAFRIGEDGTLTALNTLPSGGLSCCHLCTTADGSFVYAVNYRTGNFAEFSLKADGSLDKRTQLVQHEGHGINPDRQEGPHTHYCQLTPDGKFIVVTDLGTDSLLCYPYSRGKGIDAKSPVVSKMPDGCGPRHLVFSKSGDLAYLVTELTSTVISLKYEDGKFTKIDQLGLLPRGVLRASKAAAVRLSDDEAYLALSNRGFDSIVLVELDGEGGLMPSFLTLSGGSSPRDINFLPGDFFAAANEFSDEIRFFDFLPDSGVLTPNGFRLDLPRPLCILPY